jgi:hypothetical protein
MAVQRTYKCDLCRDPLQLDELAEAHRAIGIYWKDWPRGWILKPAREVERHLCPTCIASIQAMPKMCGQGYECSGGPGCGSDHK